jgi:hypothetical protein
VTKKSRNRAPSGKGFFIFAGGCAIAAIVLIVLLIHGDVEGPRVAPDIERKVKSVE